MMTVLGILAGIGAIVAIVLIAALFIKKGYSIERSAVIERPVGEVYDYLRNLENQLSYNVWVMKDPAKKLTRSGSDGEVGFVYGWDGNKEVGAGEQEIRSLVPNALIDVEIRFIRPFAATGQTPFVLEEAGTGATKVTWTMNSAMKYPMNFMLAIINMDKTLGKDMETSLGNVKRNLEGSL
jgi:hypothetical protein